jgi:nitrous oxidase accessory protein NosD
VYSNLTSPFLTLFTEIVMFGYSEDDVLFGHDGLTLTHNVSHSNSANGYAVFSDTDVTAVHNHGYGNGEGCTKVRSTDDSVFQFNKLFGNGAYEIYLAGDSASNILYNNKMEANDTGIFADPHAIDNLVVANKARGNSSWGIEHTTDGLLNTFTRNTCRVDGLGTSLPIGLCDK